MAFLIYYKVRSSSFTVHTDLKIIFSVFKKESQSDYNSYKLFGVDFFLDEAMKPWLLELNNFPSMEKASLDRWVNDPMIAETYNVAGFHYTGKPNAKQKQVIYFFTSPVPDAIYFKRKHCRH